MYANDSSNSASGYFTFLPFPGFDPRQLKTNVNQGLKTIAQENLFIRYLTGDDQGHNTVTKKLMGFNAEIPNEPYGLSQTYILPKATELNENVVMRFSSKVEENSVVHNKFGPDPFTATATRGTGSVRNVNGYSIPGSGLVTESALSTMDLENSSKIIAANRRASNSHAHIAQHQGGKSYYLSLIHI